MFHYMQVNNILYTLCPFTSSSFLTCIKTPGKPQEDMHEMAEQISLQDSSVKDRRLERMRERQGEPIRGKNV